MRTVQARLGIGDPSAFQGAGGLGILAENFYLEGWDDRHLLDSNDLDWTVLDADDLQVGPFLPIACETCYALRVVAFGRMVIEFMVAHGGLGSGNLVYLSSPPDQSLGYQLWHGLPQDNYGTIRVQALSMLPKVFLMSTTEIPDANRTTSGMPNGEAVAEVISSVTEFECHAYATAFQERHAAMPNSGWDVLGQVFGFHFDPGDAAKPFHPMLVMDGKRSMIPDDLAADHLDGLSQTLRAVDDPEYRARVGDVLWLRRRDINAARDAVNAYMASASRLEDPEHWVPAMERYERAVRLARQIEPIGELPKRVLAHLEAHVLHYDGQDPLYFSLKAMELLEEVRFGNFAALAEIAGKIAGAARASGDTERARSYFAVQARLLRRAGRSEDAEAALCHRAETFVADAEAIEAAGSFISAHHFWQDAVKAFRERASLRARVPELRARLAEAGRQTLQEMKTVSTGEIDIRAEVELVQKHFRGLALDDAFFQFAMALSLIDPLKLREETLERMKAHPLQSLFKADIFDAAGRKIAVRPPIGTGDPKQEEQAIEGLMDEQARLHRHFHVHAVLAPAVRVIRDEHVIDEGAIESLIEDSGFIPEDRLSLFVKGISAGFQFDFSTALHILVPQAENGLRHVLGQHGVLTRNFDANGVEDVWLLGKILDHEKLPEVLGEDMLYELRTLMAGRLGPNLRNSIAHGLLDKQSLNGEMGFYLWWVLLRLTAQPTSGMVAFAERKRVFKNKD